MNGRARRWMLVFLSLPSAATALASPVGTLPVTVEVDPCAGIPERRLADLLALELNVLTEDRDRGWPAITSASVGCGPDATLILRVSDSSSASVAQSSLATATYPPGA